MQNKKTTKMERLFTWHHHVVRNANCVAHEEKGNRSVPQSPQIFTTSGEKEDNDMGAGIQRSSYQMYMYKDAEYHNTGGENLVQSIFDNSNKNPTVGMKLAVCFRTSLSQEVLDKFPGVIIFAKTLSSFQGIVGTVWMRSTVTFTTAVCDTKSVSAWHVLSIQLRHTKQSWHGDFRKIQRFQCRSQEGNGRRRRGS